MRLVGYLGKGAGSFRVVARRYLGCGVPLGICIMWEDGPHDPRTHDHGILMLVDASKVVETRKAHL